ncbi:MAG: LysM peptidoglycan-binding domain-containing protein [Thermodesulfobacteriota bacterium]|nr:LysM peptidoglycan-binding domain-containing protein [Thermodesulfobacteriota bacterium]
MRLSRIAWRVVPIVILALSWSPPARGATAYKIYTLHTYEGQDVLCDLYTVQKDDHIWQILRQKGLIAERDFPRFVNILKGLNPHVKDVNKIYPGQELLIPLKQMEPPEGPSQEGQRYVTIPMIPDVLYKDRKVRSGDSVSKILMTHLGVRWHEIREDYLRAFRRLNPAVEDLATIYPGQILKIPELVSEDAAEPPLAPPLPSADSAAEAAILSPSAEMPPSEEDIGRLHHVVAKTVSHLGGKFLGSGYCYFPVKGEKDLRLDLETFPVIETPDGRHIVLETRQSLPPNVEKAVSDYWKGLVVIPADPRATMAVVADRVVRALWNKEVQKAIRLSAPDKGIEVIVRGDWILPEDSSNKGTATYKCITLIESAEEYTSPSVAAYLAKRNIEVVDIFSGGEGEERTLPSPDVSSKSCSMQAVDGSGQEPFVYGFAQALGYAYEPSVPISFDYAGFQVNTTASLIYGGRGLDLVVDLGTFYGETKSAVEAMGVQVLSIRPGEDFMTIAKSILAMTGIAYTENPVLLAANRRVSKTTSLTIRGVLVSHVDEMALLTPALVDPELCHFLKENRIKVLKIEPTT